VYIQDDQIQVALEDRALVGIIIIQEIVLGVEFNDDVLTGRRFLREVESGNSGGR